MLKLEKSNPSSDISIRLRDRDPWLDRFLIFGFSISILMHFMAWLLFQIKPVNVSPSFRFPPVELFTDGSSTLAKLDDSELSLSPAVPEPPLYKIRLPDVPLHISWSSLESTANTSSFNQLERDLIPLDETAHLELLYDPIQISFSSDFYPLFLENEKQILEAPKRKNGPLKYSSVTFHLIIDEKTGEVIWFEQISKKINKEIEKKSRKLINLFKFKKVPLSFLPYSGNVELIFLEEK